MPTHSARDTGGAKQVGAWAGTSKRRVRKIARGFDEVIHETREGLGAVAEGDPAAGEIVRRELDRDTVSRQHADVILPHLATQVAEHAVLVLQLHHEHGVRQGVDHLAINGDGIGILAPGALFGRRRSGSGGTHGRLAVL